MDITIVTTAISIADCWQGSQSNSVIASYVHPYYLAMFIFIPYSIFSLKTVQTHYIWQ